MCNTLVKTSEYITSLELAEVTGKQHKNVMRDIREMEADWEKVNGLKFELVDYRDKKGEIRPMYQLNKLESLYIVTKYNNEARAKLVLRWAQLEMLHQQEQIKLIALQEAQLNKAEGQVQMLLPMAEKYNLAIHQLGAMPVDVAAKIYASHGIETGRTRIYETMRRANMVCKDRGRNHCKPLQTAVEKGYLKMAVHVDSRGVERTYPTSLITAKGLDYLADLMKQEQHITLVDTLQLTINFVS